MKYTKSDELTMKFNEYYPGGHTNFRVSMEATKHRVFANKAKGSHVWDVDGNEYIKFNGAMGPSFIGHRNPEYVDSLKDFLDRSATIYGSNLLYNEEDIPLAEAIFRNVPCAEALKFCVTGSEAVQMAMRIARGYTGKSRIVRFEDHYHGWMDNVIDSCADYHKGEMPLAGITPENHAKFTNGKSPWAREECLVIPWNDFEALEDVFKNYGNEIAMIHFEGIVCNHFCLSPKPGFLEKIRELCTKHKVVMSMDEVITGFRVSLGGAQKYLNVTPDICTMAKAIAGGLPFSAVAGKKEIMNVLHDKSVLGPGTFNGYALGVHAALTTVRILEKIGEAGYTAVYEKQKRLMNGLVDIGKKYGIDMRITYAPGVMFSLLGAKGGVAPAYIDKDLEGFDTELTKKFRLLMQERGILFMSNARWYMNIAHSDDDIDYTLEKAEESMKLLTE